LKAVTVAVILCLLAAQSPSTLDILAYAGRRSEQGSLEPFTRCNDAGDAGDLVWDGSRIVSRSGIHYVTVEVTKLVYGGGIPSAIGLKAPVSVDGVTFSSPSPESFGNVTLLLGVLYITVTFADGTQRKLSAIIFLPPIEDSTPQGCALLVTHNDQQAGFVVVFTPSSEPLDNPALRYETDGKVFQFRIYLTVRADAASATARVILPPTNPQTTNATLQYDLTNGLTENGTTCTYEWGPMLSMHRTGDSFEFNYSSTSPIDVYIFSSNYYNGTISCNLGPILKAPYTPDKLPTGDHGQLGAVCMGCEPGMSDYVLFTNHDPTVTPHVTLRVTVTLQATTTTTTVSPPPSAISFIGVPEILIAILLGLFVVASKKKRKLGLPQDCNMR
jgi:hypothetical protein